ncbi:hypothetical protein Tco_0030879 [Tanacetum coccineum]
MGEMGRNEQKQLENFRNESRDFFLLVSWLLLAVNFLLNLPWTCLDHDLMQGCKEVMEVVGWLIGGDKEASKVVDHGGVRVDAWFELVLKRWKLKCICHWADPFKDLKWSNVSGVKLSSLSESNDTFSSLQVLSDLYYLFGGFMDYLWSRELDISNFGPADRKILPVVPSGCTLNALSIPCRFSALMFSSMIASVWALRICDGGSESHILIAEQF